MEQLEEVQVAVLQVLQRGDILRPEGRVASVDQSLQINRRDFRGRDVEAENLQGDLLVCEVFPATLYQTVSLTRTADARLNQLLEPARR